MSKKKETEEKTEVKEEGKTEKKFKLGNVEYLVIVIGIILLAVVVYNTLRITNIATGSGGRVIGTVSASEIIPTGVPKIYGKELGVSYDDISPNDPQKADVTIGVLANLDRTITLTGDGLQRYIKIGSQISCEYCCGAKSIIFSDGKAACGCAHSYAMRGLAKYLITEHGDEYSDDEILEELGKWKVLFFPEIHETKAAVLKEQGIKINYINLASNKYRGVEQGQGSGGGMVGGC